MFNDGVSRRTALTGAPATTAVGWRRKCLLPLLVAATALLAGCSNAQLDNPDTDNVNSSAQITHETVDVTVHEGTNLAVDATPDSDHIILGLQGKLFRLGRTGGDATPISGDFFDPYWPVLSPDGSEVAVQAMQDDGVFHIHLISTDGKRTTRQLTDGHVSDLTPAWSPDGRIIAFASARSGSQDIWTVDVTSGELTRITDTDAADSDPAWTADGQAITFVSDNAIKQIDLASGEVETLLSDAQGQVGAPSWSPDGRALAYILSAPQARRMMVLREDGETAVVSGDYTDVFPFPAAWLAADTLVYGADGKIVTSDLASRQQRVIPFSATFKLVRDHYPRKQYDFDSDKARPVLGIVSPEWSPDGQSVVFKALNDLWLMPMGGQPRQLTDDLYYEQGPAWAPDSMHIAFASDKNGSQDLYVMNVDTGETQQVTDLPGAEYAPAWSPDGNRLAFKNEKGQVWMIDLASGDTQKLSDPFGIFTHPGKPSWSANGQWVTFSVSQQLRNRIAFVNVDTGESKVIDPAPYNSVSTRGDDGPVWSPDGHWLAFIMEGTLHIMPVSPDGEPQGPAKQITREMSDSPSWSGDSQHILYVHNGQLRKVDIDGSEPQPVAMPLTFTPEHHKGTVVIHAGRLWDGAHPDVRKNVDIVVENNRIQRIVPHDPALHAQYKVVDASGLTVTPGLIDMHYHREMNSRATGSRRGLLFLSFGITTTRGTGDPAYRALAEKEAVIAGKSIGPRYFYTGEMLEGKRVFWNFATPVMTRDQLDLELGKARALGYDLIKTYDTFPFAWQADVAEAAHEMGVISTSHYLYPGIAHGVDMQEHIAGPTRWGFTFSRQRSSRGGLYGDVMKLWSEGDFPNTTTLFSAEAYLADDPELLDDPRLTTLYTSPELSALQDKLDCARGEHDKCGLLGPAGGKPAAAAEVEVFKRKLAHNAKFAVGTDASIDSSAVSLHMNLRALADNGISPFDVLQADTVNAAEILGISDDLGTIEPGKLADMIFVDGHPSEHIADLANVEMVMKDGKLFTQKQLLAPFEQPTHQASID